MFITWLGRLDGSFLQQQLLPFLSSTPGILSILAGSAPALATWQILNRWKVRRQMERLSRWQEEWALVLARHVELQTVRTVTADGELMRHLQRRHNICVIGLVGHGKTTLLVRLTDLCFTGSKIIPTAKRIREYWRTSMVSVEKTEKAIVEYIFNYIEWGGEAINEFLITLKEKLAGEKCQTLILVVDVNQAEKCEKTFIGGGEASYLKGVAAQQSFTDYKNWILFINKIDQLDDPPFTIRTSAECRFERLITYIRDDVLKSTNVKLDVVVGSAETGQSVDEVIHIISRTEGLRNQPASDLPDA